MWIKPGLHRPSASGFYKHARWDIRVHSLTVHSLCEEQRMTVKLPHSVVHEILDDSRHQRPLLRSNVLDGAAIAD